LNRWPNLTSWYGSCWIFGDYGEISSGGFVPRSKSILILSFAVLVISVASLLLQGCGSSVATSGLTGGPATFTQAYSQIIGQPVCVNCHQPSGSATASGVNLDFTSQASAYSGLTSSQVSASDRTCAGVRLVVANNAPVSYLATILFADYYKQNDFVVSGCTPTASHQQYGVSTSDENVVIGWINSGAPNN
jgi:hypothetical protein